MKSSDNRLASCQKYIFNCIFDLFGEDIKKVFLAMLTFCDGGEPQVISALTDENFYSVNFFFLLVKIGIINLIILLYLKKIQMIVLI